MSATVVNIARERFIRAIQRRLAGFAAPHTLRTGAELYLYCRQISRMSAAERLSHELDAHGIAPALINNGEDGPERAQ